MICTYQKHLIFMLFGVLGMLAEKPVDAQHHGGHGVRHSAFHGSSHYGGHGLSHYGGHGLSHYGGHGLTHYGGHGLSHYGGHGISYYGGFAVPYYAGSSHSSLAYHAPNQCYQDGFYSSYSNLNYYGPVVSASPPDVPFLASDDSVATDTQLPTPPLIPAPSSLPFPPTIQVQPVSKAMTSKSVAFEFGSFQRVDELSSRLKLEANRWCLDLHYNYTHNPNFAATYRNAYRFLSAVNSIQSAELRHDHDTLRKEISGLQPLLDSVKESIQTWTREESRTIAEGDIQAKTELVETILKDILYDVGIQPEDEVVAVLEEQAPPPTEEMPSPTAL